MESETQTFFKRYGDKDVEPISKRARAEKDVKAIKEESRFYNLFTAVLEYIIKRENTKEIDISNAISVIMKSFCSKFSDIDFERTEYMCGYLFRYGTHGAGLARNRVLDAVNHCDMLKDCFKNSELNIISLGGAFGNDMVGLCSALYEIQGCNILNLTVVDRIRRWGSCLNLVEFFLREGTYGSVGAIFRHLTANFSFIQVTLPGNPQTDQKYFRSLKEADIIVIQKLLSILQWDERKDVIKSMSNGMKQEALLLYIDTLKVFSLDECLWKNFEILYQSNSDAYRRFNISWKFGYNDDVLSEAQIIVLRKKLSS